MPPINHARCGRGGGRGGETAGRGRAEAEDGSAAFRLACDFRISDVVALGTALVACRAAGEQAGHNRCPSGPGVPSLPAGEMSFPHFPQ
jgi:hypothetical protein